jgi:hypothetical protein
MTEPKKDALVIAADFSGPNRGAVTKNDKPLLKRYAAILLDKDGKKHIGKIITFLTMEEWAKINEYSIERFFRIYKHINQNIEHTEITG